MYVLLRAAVIRIRAFVVARRTVHQDPREAWCLTNGERVPIPVDSEGRIATCVRLPRAVNTTRINVL